MATVAPPKAYTLHLPRDPRAPRIARSTLRGVLQVHRMNDLIDTAELLASELVTNAHLHSTGVYTLLISTREPRRLRIGVCDGNPDIPSPFGEAFSRSPGPGAELAENGRGLQLVQIYADAWGAYRLGGARWGHGGKLLWVECVHKVPGTSV
ncbi:ATP-binding protein [Streptomyces sp. NRRL F-5135]|uniref:ATP-binding protein n=1 Tax=Streptomyces sp. NRRL F-5135 TaxID=1463858 RepID=UPI0004C66E3A|nr:ATP-binding protein [Streptomyces sp. NRRL F-5135]